MVCATGKSKIFPPNNIFIEFLSVSIKYDLIINYIRLYVVIFLSFLIISHSFITKWTVLIASMSFIGLSLIAIIFDLSIIFQPTVSCKLFNSSRDKLVPTDVFVPPRMLNLLP